MNWLYSYKVTVRPTHEGKSVNKLAALRRQIYCQHDTVSTSHTAYAVHDLSSISEVADAWLQTTSCNLHTDIGHFTLTSHDAEDRLAYTEVAVS